MVQFEPVVGQTTADIIGAVASLAWPLIVVIAIWRLGPYVRELVAEREVSASVGPAGGNVTIGGKVVTSERALTDQRKETEEIRADLSRLAADLELLKPHNSDDDGPLSVSLDRPSGSRTESPIPAGLSIRCLMWVDDDPEGNSYELAALRDREILVTEALSTEEALDLLDDDTFDAIVTDMHRKEPSGPNPRAGLDLMERLSEIGLGIPVVVYTSMRSARRYNDLVKELGGIGATASATELFEMLGINFGPGGTELLRSEVEALLLGAGFVLARSPSSSGFDLTFDREGSKIGVELKAWPTTVDHRSIDGAMNRLQSLVSSGAADEAWLVSLSALRVPDNTMLQNVRVFALDELRKELPGQAS